MVSIPLVMTIHKSSIPLVVNIVCSTLYIVHILYINPSSKIFLIVFLQYRKDGTFLACLVAEQNGKGIISCAYLYCAAFYDMSAILCIVLCACYAMCNVPIPILCRLLYFASSVHIPILCPLLYCADSVHIYIVPPHHQELDDFPPKITTCHLPTALLTNYTKTKTKTKTSITL